MIFGIGIDIVEVNRIASRLEKGDALARRVLTEDEYAQFMQHKHPSAFLAKRFAAKEAIVKAMGTGIGNGIGWQQIQIDHDPLGRPVVTCIGPLTAWCEQHQVQNIHLSIADEVHYACANALIEVSASYDASSARNKS